jgi:hypothetical protein
MNGRLLLLPLAALTLAAVACSKDSPKPDTATTTTSASAPASNAATSATAATASGSATGGTASALPPSSASAASSGATAAASATGAPAAAGAAGTWTPFTQKSHGYSLEVPGIFVAKVNPKNIDGQDWSFGDHANITTVSLDALGESLDDYFNEATSERKGITDKKKQDNWFLIRGADKGKNFVEKSFVTARSKTDLDITYDDSVKAQIEPLIQHMLDSFKPGK